MKQIYGKIKTLAGLPKHQNVEGKFYKQVHILTGLLAMLTVVCIFYHVFKKRSPSQRMNNGNLTMLCYVRCYVYTYHDYVLKKENTYITPPTTPPLAYPLTPNVKNTSRHLMLCINLIVLPWGQIYHFVGLGRGGGWS